MPRVRCFLYITIVVAIISLSDSQLDYSERKMGPYRAVIRRMDHCEESGEKLMYSDSTKITKTGRNTYTYSANITSLIPVDDTIQATTDFAIWGNGGWRPHFMVFDIEHFCSVYRDYMPQLFTKLMNEHGISGCPIPPGTYRVMNVSLENLRNKIPTLPYGVFRADIIWNKNRTILGCERVYLDLLPLKASGNHKRKG
ncbi:uncharacterized protein [Halyomorpha halys]|uniref:uncharacterized protein n=1 Tax=Halyomorpha halys TaxID=286706 RepID=UPI0034D2E5BF